MNRCFYVNNLDPAADINEMEWLFTTVGDVESFTVETPDQSGVSRRMGVIQMASESQATNCVERFHGYRFQGMTLTITRQRPLTISERAVLPKALPKKLSPRKRTR